MKKHHLLLITSAIAGLGGFSTSALAQTAAPAATSAENNADDVIVVTARRKEENLQTVPIAVTAISQATLSKGGSFSPLDLAHVAPGIRTSGGSGNRSDIAYSIRGQGITFGNFFPSVIPYFAEVPIVSEFSTGSYFDLENVQVLRGPQGVRFGRVTDGGAVLLTPKKPTNELGGYAKVTVGDYDLHTIEAGVNLPIVSDKVLLRIAGETNRRRGFTLNVPNNQWLDGVHYDTIRATLTLRPVDGVENTTVFQYNEAHENNSNAISALRSSKFSGNDLAIIQAALTWQQANGPRRVQNGDPALGANYGLFNDRYQTIVSNTTTIDIADDIKLRNIFGYVWTRKYAGFDYDGSPLFVVNSFGPVVPRLSYQHLSDEVQLQGKTGILDWTLGAYFDGQKPTGPMDQIQVQRPNGTTRLVNGVFSTIALQRATSTAVYGQAEADLSSLTPGLKLNGGLRYTHDTSNATLGSFTATLANYLSPAFASVAGTCTASPLKISNSCANVGGAFNVVTYEVGASYQVNSNVFTYVTYRKGYRPGGFSTQSALSPTGAYQPEYDNSLELGLKVNSRLAGMPFRMNVAAFYDRYKDIQKRITLLDPSGAGITALFNVPYKAIVKGIEFEGNISPVDGLDLGYNFAVTDAKFKTSGVSPTISDPSVLNNSTNGACNSNAPSNVGFCPYNRLALTPKFQMTASIGYTLPLDKSLGDIRIGASWYHQSSMSFSDSSYLNPDAVMGGYSSVDADITWKNVGGENVDLSAFVTNLTNEVWWQGAQSVSHQASLGIGAHFYAPPRMFGVSARVHFGGER